MTVAPSWRARRSSAVVLSGPLNTIRDPGTPARRATRYSNPDAASAQQPARCRRATSPINGFDLTEYATVAVGPATAWKSRASASRRAPSKT